MCASPHSALSKTESVGVVFGTMLPSAGVRWLLPMALALPLAGCADNSMVMKGRMGQLERLTIKRDHGLELFAGGEGHGEPPGIYWAHDYAAERQALVDFLAEVDS